MAADRQHIDDLVHRMSLEQKIDYIGGTGFGIRAVPEVGLPAFAMSDGPYGTRSNAGFPSTTYAAGIGLAASWDRELAKEVGGGIGRDARARGVHFMLGPGVNIYRSPRNGRNFEYFGEDPFLAAQMTTGYIEGMQQHGVSATVKHYIANNSEYLRHDSDSVVDERALREIYLPAFEAAVNVAHVGAIMDSYNLFRGEHSTQNSYLNTQIVRNEWHFPGVMMSDWSATYDGVAAANGGLDLEMPTGKFMNREALVAAVKAGKVSEATIDDKVRHILSTVMAFHWLDRPQLDPSISAIDARNDATALKSARESAVLLKNEGGLLPLDKAHVRTLLVVGPDAYPGVPVGGGSAGVVPFHTISPVEGFSQVGAGVNVLYARGLPTLSEMARDTAVMTDAANGKRGWRHDLFAKDDLSGSPVTSVVVNAIDRNGLGRNFGGEMPEVMQRIGAAENASLSSRYTGFYMAPKAGRYVVAVESGGEGSGKRVLVDDKLLLDAWSEVRAMAPAVTLDLATGVHKMVIEERHRGGIGGKLRFAIAPEDSLVSTEAKELAAKADAVVVCAGFAQESESEGGDRTFELPAGQDALIEAMVAANPKTIVAMTSGGNFDSTRWLGHVPALLETWYGGQEGGRALAEIVFGDVTPSGHLPVTFERRAEDNPTFANYYPVAGTRRVEYKESIFVGYRGYEHNHVQPLFPFGYGLSYTTFAFRNLTVSGHPSLAHPEATVSFDVVNTGRKRGATVAQVYIGEEHPKLERPGRELKQFARVELAPGQTQRVTLALDGRSFSYYDPAAKAWKIDANRFHVYVGDAVTSTPLEAAIEMGR